MKIVPPSFKRLLRRTSGPSLQVHPPLQRQFNPNPSTSLINNWKSVPILWLTLIQSLLLLVITWNRWMVSGWSFSTHSSLMRPWLRGQCYGWTTCSPPQIRSLVSWEGQGPGGSQNNPARSPVIQVCIQHPSMSEDIGRWRGNRPLGATLSTFTLK